MPHTDVRPPRPPLLRCHIQTLALPACQLEDLAFRWLLPDEYGALAAAMDAAAGDAGLQRVVDGVRDALDAMGLRPWELTARRKNVWGVYSKMRCKASFQGGRGGAAGRAPLVLSAFPAPHRLASHAHSAHPCSCASPAAGLWP